MRRTSLFILLVSFVLSASSQHFDGAYDFVYKSGSVQASFSPMDVNADGVVDLISSEEELYWYERTTGESFRDRHLIDASVPSYDHVLADINDDGALDIVAAGYGVRWYAFEGNGIWAAPEVLQANVIADHLLLTDINDDGFDDLIYATSGVFSEINYNLGDGSGNFGPLAAAVQISGSETIEQVEVADLDGDGALDIIWRTGLSDNSISVAMGEGAGQFAAPLLVAQSDASFIYANNYSYTEVEKSLKFRIADADGDGTQEIYFLSHFGLDYVQPGNNGSFFQSTVFSPAYFSSFDGSYQYLPTAVVSDFLFYDEDDDGDVDLRLKTYLIDNLDNYYGYSWSYQWLSWAAYANDGSGWNQFVELSETDPLPFDVYSGGNWGLWFQNIGATSTTEVIGIQDVDGDGLDDILFSTPDDSYSYCLGEGGISLFDNTQHHISPQTSRINATAPIDMDQDGDIDLLSWRDDTKDFAWFENVDGELTSRSHFLDYNIGSMELLHVADLDGDGVLEVITYFNTLRVYSWNGSEYSQSFGQTQPFAADQMTTADADGDGDIDLFYANESPNGVAGWWENDGSNQFETSHEITVTPDSREYIAVGDIDGDGDGDFVSTSRDNDSEATIEVSWNEEGIYTTTSLLLDKPGTIEALAMTDLDSDGREEVVCVLRSPLYTYSHFYYVLVVRYDDSGPLEPEILNVVPPFDDNISQFLSLDDLDNDGDIDITVGRVTTDWIENLGDGEFAGVRALEGGAIGSLGLLYADIDSDNDPDLLYTRASDGRVYSNRLGEGCMDPAACNYEATAIIDSGDCCYTDCGCTDDTAENYNEAATCDDGSCEYILGCNNQMAYNYDSNATLDNGSCLYACGCPSEWAINYSDSVGLQDGSCLFMVTGRVYADVDADGDFDPEDNGLSGQLVTIDGTGLSALTDEEGSYEIGPLANQSYTLRVDTNAAFPFFSTQYPVSLNSVGQFESQLSNRDIGLSIDLPVYDLDVSTFFSQSNFLCDQNVTNTIRVRNDGNVPIDGIVEFDYDSLFVSHTEMSPIDSIVDDRLYFSYSDLAPGQYATFNTLLTAPDFNFLGVQTNNFARSWGYFEGDSAAFGEDYSTGDIICAYDPNDKRVFPEGYSEMHYIADSTELKYVIRFQNTGNAPATNVFIRDTLDADLDLSTLVVGISSHSMGTSIDEQTGQVVFSFDNIMLADSVNNEPESHGYLEYTIRMHDSLPPLTPVTNTAYIYFDTNPPIQTNTVLSTTYDCSLFEVSLTDDNFLLTASVGDSYAWFFNGDLIEGADSSSYLAEAEGDYYVEVMNDFPCSGTSAIITINVDGLVENDSWPIALYPNPMRETTTLDIGAKRGVYRLEVIDLSGRTVLSDERRIDGTTIIERRGWSPGRYTVRISQGEVHRELPLVVE